MAQFKVWSQHLLKTLRKPVTNFSQESQSPVKDLKNVQKHHAPVLITPSLNKINFKLSYTYDILPLKVMY